MRVEFRLLCRFTLIALAVFSSAPSGFGQSAACPVAATPAASSADAAYARTDYAKAEELYAQAVSIQPNDANLQAALVRTMLHEGKITEAFANISSAAPQYPHSAPILTALAEVQLRQGQPWLAIETLQSAAAADSCYARTHLIRSRVDRINSMYASERKEIQSAYDLDPTDPDIHHAWATIVSPSHDILSIQQSLETTKDMAPDTRKMAEDSVRSMLPLLSESSQTCQALPSTSEATLPLLPSMRDGKNVDAYKLEIQFPQTKASLQIDTAASGLYISRTLAEANGFKPTDGTPPGTVHVDHLQVGPLEFRDCIVGVSDTPFSGNADGFIGMDLFASYLITLDYPHAKLQLAPLPPQASSLPGDRSDAPELSGFSPIYHSGHYLLVPMLLNKKERRLFVLDTGIRYSAMASDVAHSISNTKMNFTNAQPTTSGATLQIYRDSFDFEFANLDLQHQSHVLEFDTSAMGHNAGMQIGGLLGFDILRSMTMHLDYRDGLVKFESSDGAPMMRRRANSSRSLASMPSQESPACPPLKDDDYPIASTMQARTTGYLDSKHLKPGAKITLQVDEYWKLPGCKLSPKDIVYGHITAATAKAGGSQLAIEFDSADCYGDHKKALPLKVLGMVGAPGEFNALHNAVPTEIGGGRGRQINDTISAMGIANDQSLNPDSNPKTLRPGTVLGIPRLTLAPTSGPSCSAQLTSPDPRILLSTGTEFIMMIGRDEP
jgi:tetratricopeptide (TPR) repeat protein